MLALVKTAAFIVILFLILALLSRMSAPELHLDVGVQHGVRKLVQTGQAAAARVSINTAHPLHNLVNITSALSYLEAAQTLTSAKHCETLTGCNVHDLYNNLQQQQEAVANGLFMQLQAPPTPPPPPPPPQVPRHSRF